MYVSEEDFEKEEKCLTMTRHELKIVRTRQNVADSHATLILTDAYPLSGGTQRTRDFCMNMMNSHFVVSFGEADAVGKVRGSLASRPASCPAIRAIFTPFASRLIALLATFLKGVG